MNRSGRNFNCHVTATSTVLRFTQLKLTTPLDFPKPYRDQQHLGQHRLRSRQDIFEVVGHQ
jgi:hypothetical protein